MQNYPLPEWRKLRENKNGKNGKARAWGREPPTWSEYQEDHERADKAQAAADSVSSWVQCERENCLKWRKLPGGVEWPEDDQFECSMNQWDEVRNKCSEPQEIVEDDEQTTNWAVAVKEDAIKVHDILDGYCSKDSAWYESEVLEVLIGESLRVSFNRGSDNYDERILWSDIGQRIAVHRSKSCQAGLDTPMSPKKPAEDGKLDVTDTTEQAKEETEEKTAVPSEGKEMLIDVPPTLGVPTPEAHVSSLLDNIISGVEAVNTPPQAMPTPEQLLAPPAV